MVVRWWISAFLALAACADPTAAESGSDGVPQIPTGDDDDGDGFAYGETGTYDPAFEALTWSYIPGGGGGGADDFQVSVTNRDGLTDCGLAADFDARPAFPAQQVFVEFWDSNYQDCPDGLFTIGACNHGNQDVLGSECARFREWDEEGTVVAELNATSGAMRVTDEGSRCTIELELSFPGGTFASTGTVPYSDVEAGPFCRQ